MNIEKAREFIKHNARDVELAFYKYSFEEGSSEEVVKALLKYQNPDGGFGHGLEADYLNPNSTPIATNDAIITLHRCGALDKDSAAVKSIAGWLESGDGFDAVKRRWLFAVESNRDYPHAIWWEKKDDGISAFNPTVSLAAFCACFGENKDYWTEIVREGFEYLPAAESMIADDLKCYMVAFEMLMAHRVHIIDFGKALYDIIGMLNRIICRDETKYGVEYAPVPSDFFCEVYKSFITPDMTALMLREMEILPRLQKEDGGFDITWEWHTPYEREYEQARAAWRPRITLDKLLFYKTCVKEETLIHN